MVVSGVIRLTKDPVISYAQGSSNAVCRFSGAVPRKFKKEGEPEADFFDFIAFGKQAEVIEKYVAKGQWLYIAGRMQNDNYVNKDGQKVYHNRIIVEDFTLVASKSENLRTQSPSTAEEASEPTGVEDIFDE